METAKTPKRGKQKPADETLLEQNPSLTKRKPEAKAKRASKALTKKGLSRKEKLEAARKANQAMLKAWQLIAQRTDNQIDI